MPSHPSINTNKVVVALLDGRRLKGFVFDFFPGGKTLNVFPSFGDPSDKRPATVVEFAACKAIFFVRTHDGNAEAAAAARRAASDPKRHAPRGKKVKVVFSDGEEMICCTEVYNPRRSGFFAYSIDPRSNNLRIFIVNANVRQVLTARTLEASPNRPPVQERVARLALPPAPWEEGAAIPQDLKCEAALRVLGGAAPADLAKEYGIPVEDVTFWTRSFLHSGRGSLSAEGVTGEPATDTLVDQLRARIRELEREVARLKESRPRALSRV